jgi:hypothetical protein
MWISTDAVNIFESLLSIVVCCHMKWKLFCPSLGEDKKILVVHWSQGLRLDIDSVPFEKKKKKCNLFTCFTIFILGSGLDMVLFGP